MNELEHYTKKPRWAVTRKEAAEILRMCYCDIGKVLDKNDIEPCGRLSGHGYRSSTYLYKRTEVERLAKRLKDGCDAVPEGFCFIREAAQIAGLTDAALVKRGQKGFCDAVRVRVERVGMRWAFNREKLRVWAAVNNPGRNMKMEPAHAPNLKAMRPFFSGVPSGYVLPEVYRAQYGMLRGFFANRLFKAAGHAVETEQGNAYPREVLDRVFADALPPGGYVDARTGRNMLGWVNSGSGGMPAEIACVPAHAVAYQVGKRWYKVEDILAWRERREQRRRRRVAHASRERRDTIPCAAVQAVDVPAVAEAPEHDLTTLEGLRERRAELCRRYRAE